MAPRRRRATTDVRSVQQRENELSRKIRLAFGRHPDLTLWSNPVGVAKHIRHGAKCQHCSMPFSVASEDLYTVPYGLCAGSSDLIGVHAVTVTQDMVGSTLGVFVAAELKTDTGRISDEQHLFIDLVHRRGGVAGIVRTAADLEELIKRG